MAKMAKLIDTSLCQACKACQVACKSWNKLPAVTVTEGLNYGSYQNPPDLNWHTWNIVRFTEVPQANGTVHWAFNKDSCRHCPEPFCQDYCPVDGAITKDADTGAVVINSELCGECCAECVQGCPYDIPKLQTDFDTDTGDITATYTRAYKCRLCVDRITVDTEGVNTASPDMAGITGVGPSVDLDPEPACSKVCPGGAISFGTVDEMITKAHQRLAKAWNQYPNANIYPGEGFGCMWILTEAPDKLGLPVSASTAAASSTSTAQPDRRSALTSLLKPLGLGALAVGAVALGARGGKDEESAEDSKKG